MGLKFKLVEFFEKNNKKFFSEKEIISKLNLKDYEKSVLLNILKELFSIGYLKKKKDKFAKSNQPIKIGKFQSIKGGGGYICPLFSGNDSFIDKELSQNLYDGDIILYKKGKREKIVILNILKRSEKKILGLTSNGYFYPLDGGPPQKVDIEGESLAVTQFDENGKLTEKIEKIGDPFKVENCLKAIEKKFNLKKEFPLSVLKEANSFGEEIKEEWLINRKDLRGLTTVTIDPQDAKDFDDAISIKKTNNIYRVFVHIADVSFFVKENSKLDLEARERGNSVYLPSKVYPMLPENLSNNLCSLKENVDRLCFTLEMELNEKGVVQKVLFYESVIRNRKRLSYEEAQEVLDGKETFSKEVKRIIREGWEIAKILNEKRYERGAIDFDMPELYISFDENKIIEAIVPTLRLNSHKLIEDLMILANCQVAEYLTKKGLPFIRRIHEEPLKEKVDELKRFLKFINPHFNKKGDFSSFDFQKIIEFAKGKPFERILIYRVLRTMSRAKYSIKRENHFGLALKNYCHFTSPIRRYADLTVHRILKKALKGTYDSLKKGEEIAKHLTFTEEIADEAERETMNWLTLIYLKKKIGEDFKAIICGFNNFGIIVELTEELLEGICPFKYMQEDIFLVDKNRMSARGKYTSKIFKIGEIVNVKLIRVDLFSKEAHFKIV